jgi:hypothetical protein
VAIVDGYVEEVWEYSETEEEEKPEEKEKPKAMKAMKKGMKKHAMKKGRGMKSMSDTKANKHAKK